MHKNDLNLILFNINAIILKLYKILIIFITKNVDRIYTNMFLF